MSLVGWGEEEKFGGSWKVGPLSTLPEPSLSGHSILSVLSSLLLSLTVSLCVCQTHKLGSFVGEHFSCYWLQQ